MLELKAPLNPVEVVRARLKVGLPTAVTAHERDTLVSSAEKVAATSFSTSLDLIETGDKEPGHFLVQRRLSIQPR